MSYPQKTHFLRSWEFTFFWKYLVCGFKIEISEYPTKVLYVTYSPYKYELHRTKTHEIRAKYFLSFFNSPHCMCLRLLQFNSTSYSWDLKSKRTVICGIQNFSAVFKVIWLSRELFTIMTKKNIVSASSSYKIVWIHEDYHLHFFVWFDKSVFLKVNKAFWRKHILHI